jgi:hypothetical protein
MDLYDESRSLIYIGPVMRRLKSDTSLTEKWTDLVAALLDNYCQICSPLNEIPTNAKFLRSHSRSRRKTTKRCCSSHIGVSCEPQLFPDLVFCKSATSQFRYRSFVSAPLKNTRKVEERNRKKLAYSSRSDRRVLRYTHSPSIMHPENWRNSIPCM